MAGAPEAQAALEEQADGHTVGTSAPTGSKCTASSAYALKWGKFQGYWKFNSGGAPSGALDAIKRAAATIADGTSTTCGNRQNGAVQEYRGAISTYAGISATGSCTGLSFQNEVSFGPVDGSVLAWACTYSDFTGLIHEADIKFDNTSRTWHTATSGCSGSKYDLQGVATHEFGHAFGLEHSAQSSGQVMAPTTGTCNTSQRQLGRGDQEGLRNKYGS